MFSFLFQEAQFGKFREELPFSNISVNVAQASTMKPYSAPSQSCEQQDNGSSPGYYGLYGFVVEYVMVEMVSKLLVNYVTMVVMHVTDGTAFIQISILHFCLHAFAFFMHWLDFF